MVTPEWPSSVPRAAPVAVSQSLTVMARHTSPTRAKPISVLTLREGTVLFSSVQLLYVAEL
jgi:hypothetical protein